MAKRCCKTCSSEYEPTSNNQKFCSPQCKWKLKRKPSEETYALRKDRRGFMNYLKLLLGCEICGYNDHPAALTFDHIDPKEKRFTPAHLTHHSMKGMITELSKCRVLCANCHNIHSHNQREAKNGQGEG